MNKVDVKELRERMGLSQEKFAKRLGVTPRTVQYWEAGGAISSAKHEMLHEISMGSTLYLGGDQQNVNGNNIAGGSVTVNQSDTNKLFELLSSKEAALAKAQEHIDRLLSIIEKMQQ